MRKNQKGFTLVELLVVIAILAILATVAVVGYSSFIESANESNDKTLVGQINTFLQANEQLEYDTIFDLYEGLADNGFDFDSYDSKVEGRFFFWDKKLNRIVYTDNDYNIIYPTEYKSKSDKSDWFSLNGKIKEIELTIPENGVVDINSAEELWALTRAIEADGKLVSSDLTVNIQSDINAMGANITFGTIKSGVKLTINGNGHKISNLFDNSFGKASDKSGNYTSGSAATYKCGFIEGNNGTVVIEKLTFDNCISDMNTKADSELSGGSSQVGVVVGLNVGTLTLTEVKVTNSIVKGYTKVGVLVGNNTGGGKVILDKCWLENNEVVLEADGDDSEAAFAAVIVGYNDTGKQSNNGSQIEIKNGIYLKNNTAVADESVVWKSITNFETTNGVKHGAIGTTNYFLTCDTYIADKGDVATIVTFAEGADGYSFPDENN